jgi:hypothetical protein
MPMMPDISGTFHGLAGNVLITGADISGQGWTIASNAVKTGGVCGSRNGETANS